MPDTQRSSASSPPTDRRSAAPLLTVIAAGAGLVAGRIAGQPWGDLIAILCLAVIGLCAIAAWMGAGPVPDVLTMSGREAFRVELDRGRRHRRSFAMARLEFRDSAADGSASDAPAGGIAESAVRLIGASLRITDHAWLEDGDVVILMPESDQATAEAFAERVRSTAPGRFTDRTGIAAFPDDGLTSGALLEVLERRLRGAQVPSPMVRTSLIDVADRGASGAAIEAAESGVG